MLLVFLTKVQNNNAVTLQKGKKYNEMSKVSEQYGASGNAVWGSRTL
jgi:hypothetical protein